MRHLSPLLYRTSIYLMAHMCQRPRPVNGAIFIIQNTAPRGRYPERTACITLAWLRVGGRTPDAAILFSRLCITQTATQLTHTRSVADSLLEQGRGQRQQARRRSPGQALENRGKMLLPYCLLFLCFFIFLCWEPVPPGNQTRGSGAATARQVHVVHVST